MTHDHDCLDACTVSSFDHGRIRPDPRTVFFPDMLNQGRELANVSVETARPIAIVSASPVWLYPISISAILILSVFELDPSSDSQLPPSFTQLTREFGSVRDTRQSICQPPNEDHGPVGPFGARGEVWVLAPCSIVSRSSVGFAGGRD